MVDSAGGPVANSGPRRPLTSARDVITFCLLLVTGCGASYAAFQAVAKFNQQQVSHRFEAAGRERVQMVEKELASVVSTLKSVAAFYGASTFVDREEFREYTAAVLQNSDTIGALAWAPRVTPDNAAGIARAAAADGLSAFRLLSASDTPGPGAVNELKFPVFYLQPQDASQLALGLDLLSDARAGGMFRHALATAQPVVAINRWAQPADDSVLLAALPVISDSVDDAAPLADSIAGFVVASVSLRVLLHNSLAWFNDEIDSTEMYVLDKSASPDEQLLYHSAGGKALSVLPELHSVKWLPIGWKTLEIVSLPAPGHFQLGNPPQAWLALIAGLGLTGALMAFVFGSFNTRSQAERIIAERTTELVNAREAEKINAERLAVSLADLREAKRKVDEGHAQNKELIAAITSILIGLDENGAITQWNSVAEENFGIKSENLCGKRIEDCELGWNASEIVSALEVCRYSLEPVKRQLAFVDSHAQEGFVGITVNPVIADDNSVSGFLILGANITERIRSDQSRAALEVQLRQAQKLESIGLLAAGIAHEINTPIQFVGDNIRFLNESFADLMDVLGRYGELLDAADSGSVTPELISSVREAVIKADLEYLAEDVPNAIEQSLDGTKRIAGIVAAMKAFSHPGGNQHEVVDINRAIENTVTVASNEWKYVADLELELDESVPMVPCHPQEFNQVILNLVVNAGHAIGDTPVVIAGGKGKIKVRSSTVDGMLEVRISDTGTGIPEHVQDKIFDPFFTTKEVGKGTGQGLAIAHAAIVEKHNGSLTFETVAGEGTTFVVRIPLELPEASDEQVAA